MEKPSLHAIAAMPFPASQTAMRKHYVHDWGKPVPDGVDRKRKFTVDVSYEVTTSGTDPIEVEAFSEDEAIEIAEEMCSDQHSRPWADDFEILGSEVRAQSDA